MIIHTHVHSGLRLGLDGQIEKNSAILDRNALWKKSQRIDLLPKYLCIQWMRFYWKKREVKFLTTDISTCLLTYPSTYLGAAQQW